MPTSTRPSVNNQKDHANRQTGLIPLVVLVVVGVVSASGVTVVASQGSIPGDALYPVKKAVENVKVATAISVEDKAKVHLAIAEEKVREIEKLEERGRTERIAETAQSLEGSQGKALELAQAASSKGQSVDELVALLETNRGRQQVVLTRVSEKIPQQARQAILKALEEFSRAIEAIKEDEPEEAGPSPSPSPCPSPSPSNSNVQGISNRGSVKQLRNSQYSQNGSDNPCDSAESGSGAGSRTFDGGSATGDLDSTGGGTDMGGSTDAPADEPTSYDEPNPQPEPSP